MDLVKQKEMIIENINALIEAYENGLPMYKVVDGDIETFIGNSTLIATEEGEKRITKFFTEGKVIETDLETKKKKLLIASEESELEMLETAKHYIDMLIKIERKCK